MEGWDRGLDFVTNLGTIVPKMSTTGTPLSLSGALFGQTRRAVLALLYGHPEEAYYLRQIVRATGLGLGAVQREVLRLSAAGIIRRSVRGRQVYYQANRECPVFPELKSLVVKTVGVGDVLRSALMSLADKIKVALIYGSIARGGERPGSDVDLLIVGGVSFHDVVSALSSAQKTLAREVNPTVYPPSEFRGKLAAGHHFLTSVMRQEKTFLIGDERELARLGSKRVAHRAPKRRRRNQKSVVSC
jgi:predicted nucleotidyltransferase